MNTLEHANEDVEDTLSGDEYDSESDTNLGPRRRRGDASDDEEDLEGDEDEEEPDEEEDEGKEEAETETEGDGCVSNLFVYAW